MADTRKSWYRAVVEMQPLASSLRPVSIRVRSRQYRDRLPDAESSGSRAASSVGRASGLHPEGRGIEALAAHSKDGKAHAAESIRVEESRDTCLC